MRRSTSLPMSYDWIIYGLYLSKIKVFGLSRAVAQDFHNQIIILKQKIERMEGLEGEAATSVLTELEAKIERLQGLTKGMESKIAQYLFSNAQERGIIRPNDHIGRARLFFSWLGYSIAFKERTILTMMVKKDKDLRTRANTLVYGYDVCHGFSSLFERMFNDTSPADFPRAFFVEGWGQSRPLAFKGASINADDVVNMPITNHAWNAFPVNSLPAGFATMNEQQKQQAMNQTYKVIDCGWGRFREETQGLTGAWFTRSNVDMQRTHRPLYGRYFFADPLSPKAFFIEEQVLLPSSGDRFCVDHTSVQPQNFTIHYGSSVEFRFGRSCPHVDQKRELLFLSSDTTPEEEWDSNYSGFTNDNNGTLGGIDQARSIALAYDKDGDGLWKLSFNVPKAKASDDQAKSMVIFAPSRGGRYVTQQNNLVNVGVDKIEIVARWKLI